MEKMNLAVDQLKLKYQPEISKNAEILEAQKNKHTELIKQKQLLEQKLEMVDKASGTYV